MTAIAARCLLVLALTATGAAAQGAAGAGEAPAPSAGDGSPESGPASPDVAAQTKLKTQKREAPTDAPPAPPPDEARPEDKKSAEDDTFGHGLQFGVRAGVVFGYKMDFRYEHSPLCQAFDAATKVSDQQKICGFGAAPAAEVALSFGILDGIEPYVFGRFGFSRESQTNTKPLQLLGVGARIYTMSDSRFKIFIEPALGYQMEGGAGDTAYAPPTLDPAYKKDLIFHLGVGPQYDFAKAFGIFVNAGMDVGVLRAISATLMANVGLQLRFP